MLGRGTGGQAIKELECCFQLVVFRQKYKCLWHSDILEEFSVCCNTIVLTLFCDWLVDLSSHDKIHWIPVYLFITVILQHINSHQQKKQYWFSI